MTSPARSLSASELLTAYDSQLRGEPEVSGARQWKRDGGVFRAVFSGMRGFITHAPDALHGLKEPLISSSDLALLVDRTVAALREDYSVQRIEWKTRGHDEGDDALGQTLASRGFVAGEVETVMIGRAQGLAVDLPLPPGVELRRITHEEDVRAMAAMQDDVFGSPSDHRMADALLRRLGTSDDMELWVAQAGDVIVSAGRLECVPGTEFAGIWGGATRPDWRGRGIYRALTAARARSALARRYTLIQSDSTTHSRPILERSGFTCVTTTTPYEWEGEALS